MCITVLAYKVSSNCPVILGHNRDEYYDRPYQEAAILEMEHSRKIAGGTDVIAEGRWGGVNNHGRFAIITNIRNRLYRNPQLKSRGEIVKNYLEKFSDSKDYHAWLMQNYTHYNAFNILFGDLQHVYYFSSKEGKIMELPPGLYGISNAALDTPWPKVLKAKQAVEKILVADKNPQDWIPKILQIFSDQEKFYFDSKTGIEPSLDYELSPIFVHAPEYNYGTCATMVILETPQEIFFHEKYYFQGEHKSDKAYVLPFRNCSSA